MKEAAKLILVTCEFYPIKSSGAYMLGDLIDELSSRGFEITVLTASHRGENIIDEQKNKNVKILRTISLWQKSNNNYIRTISEILIPYLMLIQLTRKKMLNIKWDIVIWYSPTIFLGVVVEKLKLKDDGFKYLILRDIFPEWAIYLGIIKEKSFICNFFRRIAKNQYTLADKIGVQSESDVSFLKDYQIDTKNKVHVLENWISKKYSNNGGNQNSLKSKTIAIYAGNMGVAQNSIIFVMLAKYFKDDPDLLFLFVGRGIQQSAMKKFAIKNSLKNVQFIDEVSTKKIYSLYKKCTIGLVSLDPKHKSSNIPGKFISYLSAGLPVFAIVNKDNDIINIIRDSNIGKAVTYENDIPIIVSEFRGLLNKVRSSNFYNENCEKIYKEKYRTEIAVTKILSVSMCR